jgi:hypothetical protein
LDATYLFFSSSLLFNLFFLFLFKISILFKSPCLCWISHSAFISEHPALSSQFHFAVYLYPLGAWAFFFFFILIPLNPFKKNFGNEVLLCRPGHSWTFLCGPDWPHSCDPPASTSQVLEF